MKLIVGLGNPGEKHAFTRHNLGFTILDHLLKEIGSASIAWEDNDKFKSEVFHFDFKTKTGGVEKIILAKPKTFMNNSGMAVSAIASFYKIAPEDIWIVHDELDLPLGAMKIRSGGSAAGHHGIESIIEFLKTEKFWRYRMGIGATHNKEEMVKHNFKNAKDFVLDMFNKHESGKVKHTIKRGVDALVTALSEDINVAMNRFNTK
jgi:PTH1 family peptidyl-tRNA hydrolase